MLWAGEGVDARRIEQKLMSIGRHTIALPAATADAMAQAASPQARAEYRRKLKEYQEARAAVEQEAGT